MLRFRALGGEGYRTHRNMPRREESAIGLKQNSGRRDIPPERDDSATHRTDLHLEIVRHRLLAGAKVVEIGVDVAGMGIAALAALRPVIG